MKDFFKTFIVSLIVVIFMATFTTLYPKPTLYHYTSLLFLIILIYYLFLLLSKSFFKEISRKFKSIFPKIGILNGSIYSPLREYKCRRSWTDVTASMWYAEIVRSLKGKTLKRIKLIPASKINDSFSIIINPFGDNFPEEDIKLHKTFYRICEFIKSGGLFVCTGGSFWAHQNTITSDSEEWVFIRTQDGMQSLKDSFFYKEFGVETTGNVLGQTQEPLPVDVYQKDEDVSSFGELINSNVSVRRFRAITSRSSDYIPIIRELNDESFPLALVRYGKGFLIHAGMFLTSAQSTEFTLILKTIETLINKKFKNL